jgi:hypothetical protein
MRERTDSNLKEKSSEEILSPEYYIKDLDPRGAFINPATIIGRQVRELRRAVVVGIFGKKKKKFSEPSSQS